MSDRLSLFGTDSYIFSVNQLLFFLKLQPKFSHITIKDERRAEPKLRFKLKLNDLKIEIKTHLFDELDKIMV